MRRLLPTWTALAASGVFAVASAFAQGGGENPRPAGDHAEVAHPSAPTDKQADAKAAGHHMDHKDMHAKDGKHAKSAKKSAQKGKTGGSMSGAGTAAARGFRGEMSRCTSMTDREARADGARTAWQRERGASS